MLDRFNRKINYLRISVTDRCNQRCVYCMPPEGIPLLRHEDILSFEEIEEVVKIAVRMGIDKIRLTGGEPLVKRDIISLVLMIANIKGVKDLSMTTNGILLEKYALPLKEAGLHRLNVSLDSVDRKIYSMMTRTDTLDKVLDGLKKTKEVGFTKIKLNCVITTEEDRKNRGVKVKEFAEKNGFELRYIRKMDIAKGEFWQVEGGEGGNCKSCNRLRLSSNGDIYPCLFSNKSYSIKKLGIEKAIEEAVNNKPESGESAENNFSFIGG